MRRSTRTITSTKDSPRTTSTPRRRRLRCSSARRHLWRPPARWRTASRAGAMRRLGVEGCKGASDLRLLSMGPRAGLSEISPPAVQPGSSIMPGKVNPSVPEMVNQVGYQVIGCDQAIALACEAGQLELNVMMPVIAWNALHASTILREAMKVLRARTVDGIAADPARAKELLERSTATATALSPYIGYTATAEIAKMSVATGRTIRELVLER